MTSSADAPGLAAAAGWMCPICSVEQPMDTTYCSMCLYSHAMSRLGVPQIFAGYAIHFNGVIPRTIMHPSHTVEWRMAERHGAVCMAKFDPNTVNLLVYRPGYERSDKCRLCVEKYPKIPAVPITWLLDSMLQSRQIHPSLYRLTSIPAVANPTVRGTNLPHHQHPFYQLNREEYAIPTSFPPPKKSSGADAIRAFSGKGISLKDAELLAQGGHVNIPPFYEVDPIQFTNVNVYDAVVACARGKYKGSRYDEENDEMEARPAAAGIELILSQQPLNKVDKMLFSGMSIALSPALQSQKSVVDALTRCGAKLIDVRGNPEKTLRSEVTHVLYAHEDKKCDLLIQAAYIRETELPGLRLVQSNWLEDCFLLGELLPMHAMYVPTAKLMDTLNKKYSKMRA